jgi:hemolysin D
MKTVPTTVRPQAQQRRTPEQAFLPAALEVQVTPPSPLGRRLLWSLLLLLVSVIAWSFWARIDIVASAPGKVVPGGRVKVVQAFESGVVSALHVTDGDHVEEGDLLLELDPTEAAARLQQIDGEIEATRQHLERLTRLKLHIGSGSKSSGETVEPGKLNEAHYTLLVHELREHATRLAQISGEREQRETELRSVKDRTAALRDILELISERGKAVEQLATVGHIATEAWLKVEQERREMEAELTALDGQQETLRATVSSLDRTRASYRASRLREVTDELASTIRQLARLHHDQAAARLRLERHRLLAPVSGYVQQLALHTVGGVATPAQELLRIVPDEDELEIEASVLNRDSAEVQPGMPAVVKVQAYPFTRHGTLQAEIISLSADALADQALGLVYTARVRLGSMADPARRPLRLEPGMAVTVEIHTGRRRVIELLLNPLVRALMEAGRER